MVILTSGAHILSDVNDFLKGLDSVPSAGSGAVVRGYLTPAEALTGALVLFGMGGGLTALIVYLVGLPLLLISGIG
jgi:1,4-dihydroxy-2-naphthoate octaprenyltransferase